MVVVGGVAGGPVAGWSVGLGVGEGGACRGSFCVRVVCLRV